MLNRFFFINCFFFLFVSLVSAATIRGTVISNRERLPVAYATLLLKGTDIGAITNEKGEFSFPSLLPGSYRFIVSAVGYVPLETPEYLLRTKDVSITIELEESIEQLAEVVVSANPYDHLAKNPISVHAIGIQEIEKSPGANRDISKIIQAYPGVSYSAVGYRNDLMVRGGGPSENKFYLDGIEIPSINHFSTQGATGGVSGIINADLLRDVQFYSADFPANAGNAVSSVLQFNLKDGTVDGTNYKGTLGASEVSFVTSGHFSEKSTYICSVRRSYLQFLFKLLDLPFLPTYSDAQFKWKHRFNSKNELTLLGLVGIDDLKINDDASSERAQYTIGYIPEIQQQAFTIGAKYKFYAPHSIRSVIASYSFLNNKSEKYKDNNREQADLLRLKYSSQERKAQLRIENKTTLRNWTLMYGGEANYFSYDMESKQQLFFDTTPVMQIYATDLSYLNWGTYFSLLYATPQNKINVSFALRADACSYNSYMRNPLHQLSPRFKFSYLINRHVTASVNMGIYNQRPPATALGFKDNAGVYLNKDLQQMRVMQVAGGLSYHTDKGLELKGEIFHKRYSKALYTVKDQIPLNCLGDQYGIVGNEQLLSTAMGRTYGVELMAKYIIPQKMNMTASLTLYKSEFRLNESAPYIPSSWDNQFLLHANATYYMARNWSIGAKWQCIGASPYTPYDLEKSSLVLAWNTNQQPYFDYSAFNTSRRDIYNQLDLRLDKSYYWKKYMVGFYLDIQNLFKNKYSQPQVPISTGVVANPQAPIAAQMYEMKYLEEDAGSMIPTIGVTVEF